MVLSVTTRQSKPAWLSATAGMPSSAAATAAAMTLFRLEFMFVSLT